MTVLIAPKVPFLNIISAVGLEKLLDYSSRLVKVRYFGHVVVLGILSVNFLATVLFVAISSLNYPGGDVFSYLHNEHLKCHQVWLEVFFTFSTTTPLKPEKFNVSVHISNLAAQTGVSRFGEECPNWVYDKTEAMVQF